MESIEDPEAGDVDHGWQLLCWPAGKLLDFFGRFAGVIEKSEGPPATNHLRLVLANGVLTGFGRGKQVHVEVSEPVVSRVGACVVNLHYWPTVKLLRSMKSDEELKFVVRANEALLVSSRSSHPIKTMEDRDCGARDLTLQAAHVKSAFEVGGPELLSALKAVEHALDDGNRHDAHNGASIRQAKGRVWLQVMTPSLECTMQLHVMKTVGVEGVWQLRAKAVRELLRQLKGYNGRVRMQVGWDAAEDGAGLLCAAECGKNIIRSELLFARTWDMNAAIEAADGMSPEAYEPQLRATIGRKELAEALKRLRDTRHKNESQEVVIEAGPDAEWLLTNGSDKRIAEEKVAVEHMMHPVLDEENWSARFALDDLLGGTEVGNGYEMVVELAVGKRTQRKALRVTHPSHEGFDQVVFELVRAAEEEEEAEMSEVGGAFE